MFSLFVVHKPHDLPHKPPHSAPHNNPHSPPVNPPHSKPSSVLPAPKPSKLVLTALTTSVQRARSEVDTPNSRRVKSSALYTTRKVVKTKYTTVVKRKAAVEA